MKSASRLLGVLLSVMLVSTLLPSAAFATEPTLNQSPSEFVLMSADESGEGAGVSALEETNETGGDTLSPGSGTLPASTETEADPAPEGAEESTGDTPNTPAEEDAPDAPTETDEEGDTLGTLANESDEQDLSTLASEPSANAFDITEGNISIAAGSTAGTLKVTYGSAQTTKDNIAKTEMITIIGGGTQTGNTITVASGISANITLDNVNIDRSATNWVWAFIMSGAEVNLTLQGTNTLSSGYGRAGLQVPSGSTLTIDGEGSLAAQGGAYAAGIGGGNEESGGTITIYGGTVTAQGGSYAAGIGGGNKGAGSTITIYGGTVTAQGGYHCAGIGGGDVAGAGGRAVGGTVIIAGGNVTATAGSSSPNAIGYADGGYGGTVTVSGAYQYWTSSANSDNSEGTDATVVTFTNDSTTFQPNGSIKFIKLVGSSTPVITVSLPIGTIGKPYKQYLTASGATPITWSLETGTLPDGLSLSSAGIITGTPTVIDTFSFTVRAANAQGYITKGFSIVVKRTAATVSKPTISETTLSSITANVVEITGNDEQSAEYAISRTPNATADALAWQDGVTFDSGLTPTTPYYIYVRAKESTNHHAGSMQVSDVAVTTSETMVAVGGFVVFGGALNTDYSYANNTLTILTGAALIISNSDSTTATTDKIVVASGITANITLSGVNINVSATQFACAFNMGDAEVNLTLQGANALSSGYECAGLQAPFGSTLTIDGEGSLAATGGSYGAGIGGCDDWAGGTITINGGTVTATGASGSAGIGGGWHGGSGCEITINGGTVTAQGGGSSAGIGDGNSGAGCTITITGGTVNATGGTYGSGIGSGGFYGSGCTTTIYGGTITATGGEGGAGIGGGYQASGGTVIIAGGNVTATAGVSGAPNAIGYGIRSSGGTVTVSGTYQYRTNSANTDNSEGTDATEHAFNNDSTTFQPNGSIKFIKLVGSSAPVITVSLPVGTVGKPYRQNLTASGETPITWSHESGTLPPGLSLSSAGIIMGTPTAVGTFPFTVGATNAQGYITKDFSVIIKRSAATVSKPIISRTTLSSITANAVEITGNDEQSAEYAIFRTPNATADALTWQDGVTFDDGLTPTTPYYIYARAKESTNHYAGPMQVSDVTVTTPETMATAGPYIVVGGTLNVDYKYQETDGGWMAGYEVYALVILTDAPLIISNIDSGAPTRDRILVSSGITANITLNNVNIGMGSSAIEITGGAAMNLTLQGVNQVTGGGESAGIRVPTDSILTIDGAGSLTATGGSAGGYSSAGIGGNRSEGSGTITINGGVVTARGGNYGAGIGGGSHGSGGTITINGGTVTATGGNGFDGGGAGVGGGYQGGVGSITINGGTVIATAGNSGAAGIGGGRRGSGGTITITGGTVTATAGSLAPNAIGYGQYVSDGTVTVDGTFNYWTNTVNTDNSSGDATVTGAAFDNDNTTFAPNESIKFIKLESTTAPTITTTSLSVGTFDWHYSQTLTASGAVPVTWSYAEGSLPDGLELNENTGVISGNPTETGTFEFTVYAQDAVNGYDSRDSQELSITISQAPGAAVSKPVVYGTPTVSSITITAVTVTGYTGQVAEYAISDSASADLSLLTWKTGTDSTSPISFDTLSPNTTYYVYARAKESTNYSAGTAQVSAITTAKPTSESNTIDVSDTSFAGGPNWTYDNGVFTISGDVTLTGTTTANRVVVKENTEATITLDDVNINVGGNALNINGAEVNLTLVGSNTLQSGWGYAGIGVPSGSALTIGGEGSLAATGGIWGAGIGGNDYGSSGSITINSGIITASGGGDGAAGIGGGWDGSGGTIAINGGMVTAIGGESASGIGYGPNSSGGTLTMDGNAVVVASSVGDTSVKTGGILIAGTTGTVYGTAVTPTEDWEVPADATLTIGGGQTITNNVTLTNNGTILIKEGGALANSGTIINNGEIITESDGTLANSGTVKNSGTVANDGDLTNDGAFTNTDTGTVKVGNGGTLTNNGTVANDGGITNEGTITNTDTGTVNVGSDGTLTNKGTVSNGGSITNNGSLTNSGTVTNDGGITNNGTVTNTDSATVTNNPGSGYTGSVPSGNGEVTYSVTYHLNSGTQQAGTWGVYSYGAGLSLPIPARTGYTFDGWYANADLTTGGAVSVIYATDSGNREYWAKWTVISVIGITLSNTELILDVGASNTLHASITPADAADASITWTTSDAAVATVDASGKVTAVSVGTATITATTTDGGFTDTCMVTVLVNYDILDPLPIWSGTGDATARIDAPYDRFIRLMLDGSEVDSANYTVTDGSTIITFKESYLKTLDVGTHTFRAEFGQNPSTIEGYADLTLVVQAASAAGAGSGTASGNTPATGDSNNLLLAALIPCVLLGLLLVVVSLQRKARSQVQPAGSRHAANRKLHHQSARKMKTGQGV